MAVGANVAEVLDESRLILIENLENFSDFTEGFGYFDRNAT